jgi:hypothetical protein
VVGVLDQTQQREEHRVLIRYFLQLLQLAAAVVERKELTHQVLLVDQVAVEHSKAAQVDQELLIKATLAVIMMEILLGQVVAVVVLEQLAVLAVIFLLVAVEMVLHHQLLDHP